MKIKAGNIFCVFIGLALTSCAFAVPDVNPITQINLYGYNANREETVFYTPRFPNPVKENHPLYQAVAMGKMENIPEVIRNINIAIASDEQYKEALRETLDNSNLLAPDATKAFYYLDVFYVENNLWQASTTIRYKLRKKGDNSEIFDREFTSQVLAYHGVKGSTSWSSARLSNRFAHIVNIASITWCLEHYDGTSFPADCNLHLAKSG